MGPQLTESTMGAVWYSGRISLEDSMQFGLHITAFQPSTGQAADLYPELRQRAQWAEAAGFQYISFQDHLRQFSRSGAQEDPILEPWVALAALAEATSTIQLLTLVSNVSYRSPALLAKMAATLDVISGGRLVLGIGAGGMRGEQEDYGFDLPSNAALVERLQEAVRIIKALWREPRVTYEGEFWQVRDAVLEPKPLHMPRVLVGGSGRHTLRVAAEEADLCDFNMVPPEAVAGKLDALHRHLQEAGREAGDVEVTSLQRLLLASTHDKAVTKLGGRTGYASLTGTPSDVVAGINAFQAAGVHTLFIMVPDNDQETLELFESEVMPVFKAG